MDIKSITQKIQNEFKELDFNWDKLEIYNVNRSVINCHNFCKSIEIEKDFADEIKKYIEENSVETDEECIDLLGVYISLENNDQSNILLSIEKIDDVAKKYGIEEITLYDFVMAHELAHAMMCPKLSNQENCSANSNSGFYTFIEESLANAYALKIFQDDKSYAKIKKFVQNHPPQYRYSLEIIKNSLHEIESKMVDWKIVKCYPDYYREISQSIILGKGISEKLITEFYEQTGNERFIPQSVKDAFLF